MAYLRFTDSFESYQSSAELSTKYGVLQGSPTLYTLDAHTGTKCLRCGPGQAVATQSRLKGGMRASGTTTSFTQSGLHVWITAGAWGTAAGESADATFTLAWLIEQATTTAAWEPAVTAGAPFQVARVDVRGDGRLQVYSAANTVLLTAPAGSLVFSGSGAWQHVAIELDVDGGGGAAAAVGAGIARLRVNDVLVAAASSLTFDPGYDGTHTRGVASVWGIGNLGAAGPSALLLDDVVVTAVNTITTAASSLPLALGPVRVGYLPPTANTHNYVDPNPNYAPWTATGGDLVTTVTDGSDGDVSALVAAPTLITGDGAHQSDWCAPRPEAWWSTDEPALPDSSGYVQGVGVWSVDRYSDAGFGASGVPRRFLVPAGGTGYPVGGWTGYPVASSLNAYASATYHHWPTFAERQADGSLWTTAALVGDWGCAIEPDSAIATHHLTQFYVEYVYWAPVTSATLSTARAWCYLLGD